MKTRKRWMTAGFACAFVAAQAGGGATGGGGYGPAAAWCFDSDKPDQAPAGWGFAETHPGKSPGRWHVVADEGAPSKPNVLRLAARATGGTYNLALVEKPTFRDADVRVYIRADGGKEDQGGGLLWRCADENNYYVCRINPLEGNFRLYKVVEGKRTMLKSVDVHTETRKWYRLRVTLCGDEIACYLDGRKLLESKDEAHKQAGRIGLWTKADASSSFDNLEVFTQVDPQDREAVKAHERPRGA